MGKCRGSGLVDWNAPGYLGSHFFIFLHQEAQKFRLQLDRLRGFPLHWTARTVVQGSGGSFSVFSAHCGIGDSKFQCPAMRPVTKSYLL